MQDRTVSHLQSAARVHLEYDVNRIDERINSDEIRARVFGMSSFVLAFTLSLPFESNS